MKEDEEMVEAVDVPEVNAVGESGNVELSPGEENVELDSGGKNEDSVVEVEKEGGTELESNARDEIEEALIKARNAVSNADKGSGVCHANELESEVNAAEVGGGMIGEGGYVEEREYEVNAVEEMVIEENAVKGADNLVGGEMVTEENKVEEGNGVEMAGKQKEVEEVKNEADGLDVVEAEAGAGGVVVKQNGGEESVKRGRVVEKEVETPNTPWTVENLGDDELSGTEEEQSEFMKELETFYRERSLDFKPPKFYQKELNLLKLWRAVTRLGGYDKVTTHKLWKHAGGTFRPPKTCTTVSWTFRSFYEKALLDYERHIVPSGDLPFSSPTDSMSVENQVAGNQASGSGRVRRDAAARAMQGWHSQRLLGNGEDSDPITKDRSPTYTPMHEKQLGSEGVHKTKKSSILERATKSVQTTPKATKAQMDMNVVDIGAPADWVKINVRKTKDCFEIYALVPGLLREEVRVQSDPAGRLVISGEPEKPDNPWGVTPFKKVVSLPSRIDPLHTSAVVTLHGQLFVRAPFEQSSA